ncbi:SPFH domain-containing protein [Ideonella sp. 4Y11]|uniref:SPFH domain-containing protein n=1 Tax=Ideonella aquatica TaxID=2824119 RepID=A0A940YJ44_9BURK|nr:SPFH domain-containing protein [Ideonella aquatica]MBQ0961203.1 SPFH domain-containing protein [Ideonella aquatica]
MNRLEHVERSATTTSGYPIVLLIAGLAGTAAWQVFQLANDQAGSFLVIGVSVVLAVLLASGLYMLQPNTGALLMLFGAYRGTDRREGLRWTNPLLLKRTVSLRARTLNMSTLKVNDKRGNPVEIAAAVVWQVHDTAQASFSVDDVERFVALQAESALRHLASRYAYDDGDAEVGHEPTLRGSLDEVAQALQAELQQRFEPAGVRVQDAKLTHLAYAPEIAQAMLRRQQAEAVIAARAKIVHGAVSMVEAALKGLSEREIVQLDDERKAAMVSNLLVVLCSDKDTQPIVNAGTLYN